MPSDVAHPIGDKAADQMTTSDDDNAKGKIMSCTLFYKKAEVYHNTAAPLVAYKVGETGFYPVYSKRSAEELNTEGVTEEILESAETASMFGWDKPVAKLALDFANS